MLARLLQPGQHRLLLFPVAIQCLPAISDVPFQRIDPLQVSTLDALRTQILSDMKGDELEDALTAYGSTLENDLSTSAMNKMPASKIVNPSSSSNS